MEFVEEYRGWSISYGGHPRQRHEATKEGHKRLRSWQGLDVMHKGIDRIEGKPATWRKEHAKEADK